ncbi:hypothetical protein KEM56_005559 [Ascosphaera pollenicola]|nr:hypothetical protein KEM56_005559 [Ascosphaera pollenicola]
MQAPVVPEGPEPEGLEPEVEDAEMDDLAETLKVWEQTPTPVSSKNPFRSNNEKEPDPKTKSFPLAENVDLSTVSDLELANIAHGKSAPTLSWTEDKHVMRLSREYVLKCGKGVLESEAKALRIAKEEHGLNVPRVHRAFSLDEEKSPFGTCGYIVMDYIDAERLSDEWIFFPLADQENISLKVAEAICRMQSMAINAPGPIGGGPCRGRFFSKPGVAAFNSTSEMESWFEQKLTVSKRLHQCPQDLPSTFKLANFVLVHQSLVPENLMIDEEGMVWIVGWSNAGAYPPYFERASIAACENFVEYKDLMLDVLPEEEVKEKQLAGLRYAVDAANY